MIDLHTMLFLALVRTDLSHVDQDEILSGLSSALVLCHVQLHSVLGKARFWDKTRDGRRGSCGTRRVAEGEEVVGQDEGRKERKLWDKTSGGGRGGCGTRRGTEGDEVLGQDEWRKERRLWDKTRDGRRGVNGDCLLTT